MINDQPKFVESLWNWDILKGCFGNGIKPTDIDGLVERNGHFLLLEAKNPGKEVPVGQQILFDKLVAIPSADSLATFTVFVVWGRRDASEAQSRHCPMCACFASQKHTPETMLVWGKWNRPAPCTVEVFRDWARYWWFRAERWSAGSARQLVKAGMIPAGAARK